MSFYGKTVTNRKRKIAVSYQEFVVIVGHLCLIVKSFNEYFLVNNECVPIFAIGTDISRAAEGRRREITVSYGEYVAIVGHLFQYSKMYLILQQNSPFPECSPGTSNPRLNIEPMSGRIFV